jgi:peptidoglycan-associated lipoprotein
MSNAHLVSTRTTLASAALLSLALLAGCESTASNEQLGSANADLATTNDGPGVVVGDAFPTVSEHLASVGDRVHFELDRYDLSPEAQATLRQQAALLQSYPQVVVTIEGHADERGTREYNLALGERRADAVRNYLTALGISPDRVTVISYGKERPECPGADEQCWSQNRRGVTVASQ